MWRTSWEIMGETHKPRVDTLGKHFPSLTSSSLEHDQDYMFRRKLHGLGRREMRKASKS